MKHLPRKPSRLIRLSLKDLAEREADPRYHICMGDWHSPCSITNSCSVCLAGSVMARLGATPKRHRDPINFGIKNCAKLYAINNLRSGHVREALEELDLKRPVGCPRRVVIPDYTIDRDGFFKSLNRLADRLEKVGL